MEKSSYTLLEKTKNDIKTYINNFLHGKISFEECKSEIQKAKTEYLNNAPKQKGINKDRLISIDQALIKGCGILTASGNEVTDLDMLFTRLKKMQEIQKSHGTNTEAHKSATELLCFTDATAEALGLGITIKNVEGIILPPDDKAFSVGNGTGEWKETAGGFNKATPLIDALRTTFHIDPKNPNDCHGYTGAIDTFSSRKQSYCTLIFPNMGVSIFINNLYGQGLYIIDGCIDEAMILSITKNGWKAIQNILSNPQKFTSYHIHDPMIQAQDIHRWQSEIISKINGIIQQDIMPEAINHENTESHSPQRESNQIIGPYPDFKNKNKAVEKQLAIQRFENIGYDKLMGYSKEQIHDISVKIGDTYFGITYLAGLLGNDNKTNRPNYPLGFKRFITQLFNKPSLETVFTQRFENIGYDKLMGYSQEQIHDIDITFGDSHFGIDTLATLLGNDNKTNNPETTRGFQRFISKLFNKPFLESVFTQRFEKIGYKTLMGYSQEQIHDIDITIGDAHFGIGTLATLLGNDNKTNRPNYPLGFKRFITQLFNKPSLETVFTQRFESIGYKTLMGYSQEQIYDIDITIGDAHFGIDTLATLLGNDNKTNRPNTPLGFRKFINFVVFKKTQEEYDEWMKNNK